MFPGKSIVLKEGAHIGHGAIIHGANVGRNCLIGMNSVLMDGAQIGDECIVGAMSFVKTEDEMIAWKTAGTKLYQQLPQDCRESLREVEPLRKIPKSRPQQEDFYKTLQEIKRKE